MPVVMGMAWLGAPYLVACVLPEFISGIPPMKILIIGVFFLSLVNPYEAFLIAIKKHYLLIPIYCVSSLVAVLLHYWAIESGFGIFGVACTTSFVFFLNFSLNFFCAALFLLDWRSAVKRFVFFSAHCVYLVLALLTINYAIQPNMHPILSVSIQILLFSIFCIPLFVITERRFGLLSLIRDQLLAKKKMGTAR
jgi:O-antigen/teichoic acid export membrane protein